MVLNLLIAQLIKLLSSIMLERDLLITFNFNHHRLQYSTLTTIDSTDFAAGRGGKQHARILFVFKQRLTFFNLIAFLHQH